MSAAVAQIMSSRIHNNALKHKPTTRAGLLISGGGYQGKTETPARSPPRSPTSGLSCTATATPTRSPAPATCTSQSPTCRPQ